MGHQRVVVLLVLFYINIVCTLRPEPSKSIRGGGGQEEDGGKRSENCLPLTYETEGPYWVEENIESANLKANLSYGVPLNLTFRVADAGQLSLQNTWCQPIRFARIDLWQCRYDGRYSDETNEGTEGETWLRGYQFTNSTGYATFYTIYPGWYISRTVHIHMRVRLYNADNSTAYEATTQLYFDDSISDSIFNNVYPYNARGLRAIYNNNDTLFVSSNVLSLVGDYSDQDGYSSLMEFTLPLASPIQGDEEDGITI